ncbi:MAG TPA: contact-dependent growth inhibition system immunity protein [Steroidobacteraceae bacterium]
MNEVPRRQFAAAYRHPKFFIVETWSGYRSSAFDPEGALHLLPPDCGDSDLGAAVLDALARSRFFSIEEVRTNGFFDFDNRNRINDAWVEKLLAAKGLKTKRALFKDLDYCEITLADGTISLAPRHHVKLEAWEEVPGVADLNVGADRPPAEVGFNLRRAFGLCTKA